MSEAPRLLWKLEDVADRSGDPSPDDVGPAWITWPATENTPRRSEKVRGGEWITRAEAQELALANGYVLKEDAGAAETGEPAASPPVDVVAINSKLRSLGISADELAVRASGDRLVLTGSLLQRLKTRPSKFRTALISLHADNAMGTLDELVPGWR